MYQFSHIETFYHVRLWQLRRTHQRLGKAGQFLAPMQFDKLLRLGDALRTYRKLSRL